MNREKLIQMISDLIIKESLNEDTSPMEFYNHWVQVSGVKVEDLAVASWLLDFIKDALSSNKDLLSYFI